VEISAFLFFLLNVCISIISSLREIIPYFKYTNVTSNMLLNFHSQLGMYKLFLSSELIISQKLANDTTLTSNQLAFSVFSMSQQMFGTFQTYFIDSFVLVGVFSMWSAVRVFEKYTTDFCNAEAKRKFQAKENSLDFVTPKQSQQTICNEFIEYKENFKNLESFFHVSNEIFSSLVFFYIAQSILLYATTLNSVFLTVVWVSKLAEIFPLLICSATLLLAADVQTKVRYSVVSSHKN